MESKWFKFQGNIFINKRSAMNKKEMWPKTLNKWALGLDGYTPIRGWGTIRTCGLCDIYFNCDACIISMSTGNCCYEQNGSTNADSITDIMTKKEIEIMYIFLLFVKEAEGYE